MYKASPTTRPDAPSAASAVSTGPQPQPTPQQFASDNYAGICPDAWAAMHEANTGHAFAYGDDSWTARAADAFRKLFDAADCEVFFAFNGTAANSLALAALCQSYHSVICADTAHVETDECGAPEFFSNGSKILTVKTDNGKLTPAAIRALATNRSDIHFPKPKVVTITQPTETGLVYTVEEVKAISAVCRELGLHLHMDGSRFANACASLGCAPADITWKAGVEVLCFGGTKNGMAVGEAILFFNPAQAEDFGYRCKQAGQLASKMRFLSAPWVSTLENGSWLKNARHANACARQLAKDIVGLPGISLMFNVEANGVFLTLSPAVQAALRERGWRFYTFIGGGARFMFAWDSQPARIAELVADLTAIVQQG